MGFLSGRVAFARFRIRGAAPRGFSADHLHRLTAHAAGTQRQAAADNVQVGWTAGDHVLDTDFTLAKNVVNDALAFGFRVDGEKVPADLARAYFQIELKALSLGNPSGNPGGRQKREAREAARERLAREGKDGRFVRRKVVDCLWDAASNELLIASPAVTVLDRLAPLFQQTFNRGFDAITAGTLAFDLAEPRQQSRAVDDAGPAPFVPSASAAEVAWSPDAASRDFAGNEFLLWLWYLTDNDEDTIKLSDGSEVAVMLARTLTLECPRGQTGKESITSDGPARLPEARRAIQSGKLPRKAGLTLVRHDEQYELTLHAESLAVSGTKLPAVEGEAEQARREARLGQIRHLVETMDLLYDAFGRVRFGPSWPKELGKVQRWLKGEGRAARAG
jgi:hypothetical protein